MFLLLMLNACDIDIEKKEDGTRAVKIEVDEARVAEVKDNVKERWQNLDVQFKAGDKIIRTEDGRLVLDNGERQIELGSGEGLQITRDGETITLGDGEIELGDGIEINGVKVGEGGSIKIGEDGVTIGGSGQGGSATVETGKDGVKVGATKKK